MAKEKIKEITMTKKELANLAGYTYRRLYDIDRSLPEDQKIFVAASDGKYELSTFIQRWVNFQLANQQEVFMDLEKVKAKHEVIKAEKTQLEVDKMRGQLVDVKDVRKLWGDIANSVMQNMIHLPSKIAPMILMMDNVELVSSIIDEEIRKVLEAISETPLPEYAVMADKEESEVGEGV